LYGAGGGGGRDKGAYGLAHERIRIRGESQKGGGEKKVDTK